METAYEKTLKALDRHHQVARAAALAADALDDKIRFQRLATTLEDARRKLRLMYYEYEDAKAVADAVKV